MAKKEEEWAWVDDVECVFATEKGLKCILIGTDRPHEDAFWIARKQVNEDDSDVQDEGDIGMLVIVAWKARELGLV